MPSPLDHALPASDRLRQEIAQAAARLIADDGLDYGQAKHKAAELICGSVRAAGAAMPDNAEVEDEVRAHLALFHGERQPLLLAVLRDIALAAMRALSRFEPHLTGAVLNGTASAHSDIHLQLFTDDAKLVAFQLLDAGIDYEVSETRHFGARHRDREPVETLSFLWRGQFCSRTEAADLRARLREARGEDAPALGLHLAIYPHDDLRGALRPDAAGRVERAGIAALGVLLAASPFTRHDDSAS